MVGHRHNLLIALVVGLILGTVAPALATPPPGSLPKWKPHKQFLRRLDGFVADVHHLATTRGLEPGSLHGMSPIQLTGSSVYRLPAFARRNQLPTFEDFDLRMVGVTVEELKDIVTRRFPGVNASTAFHMEPSYLPGILHVQVKLKGRQLDLSLYENAETYLAPHQHLTMAALKLNLSPTQRLTYILPRLTSVNEALGLRAQHVILDPGASGIEDARAGLARTYDVPGMDPVRKPEGLLHAAYWVGKVGGDKVTIEPHTMAEFRKLTQEQFREFFAAGKGLGQRRRNYVFSSFRVRDGRDPMRSINMLRDADALHKIFPGMERVVSDKMKWARTQERVRSVNAHVRSSLRGRDERQAREVVLGALLSEVDDIEEALSNFTFAKAARKGDFSKQRVIDAWKWFRKSGPTIAQISPPEPKEQEQGPAAE